MHICFWFLLSTFSCSLFLSFRHFSLVLFIQVHNNSLLDQKLLLHEENVFQFDLIDSILDCRKNLCGYFDGLFNIYCMAINGGGGCKVSAEDSLHLVEALRYVC